MNHPKHPHRPRPDADEMAGLPRELWKGHPADVPTPLERQVRHIRTTAILAIAIGYALGLAMPALLVHITLRII